MAFFIGWSDNHGKELENLGQIQQINHHALKVHGFESGLKVPNHQNLSLSLGERVAQSVG